MAKKSFKEKVDYLLNSPEAFRYIIYGVVAIVGIILAIILIKGVIEAHNDGEAAGKEISDKNKACELMTDAYNKCSYSYSEKRCVCKKR